MVLKGIQWYGFWAKLTKVCWFSSSFFFSLGFFFHSTLIRCLWILFFCSDYRWQWIEKDKERKRQTEWANSKNRATKPLVNGNVCPIALFASSSPNSNRACTLDSIFNRKRYALATHLIFFVFIHNLAIAKRRTRFMRLFFMRPIRP